ncbi:MAG: hypothetical protein BroJett011_64790 [Chloroflexota bacterium]|nr:MAG: hypothetical protein BroJett011_64790 [Chloroflexota bacterium]
MHPKKLLLCFAFLLGFTLISGNIVRADGPGDLDLSFGTAGKVTTSFSDYDTGNAVAIQADGKILVGGSGVGNKFVLARYNPNGSLDTSFEGDGKVITDFGSSIALADITGLAIQTDGKIVATGYITLGGNQGDFALARYNTDGSLDTSFDGDGKATFSFNEDDRSFGVAIQPHGKIVATGYTLSYPSDLVSIRLNSNGSLDTSFDYDGIIIANFGNEEKGSDVVIQPDGKIVVASKYSGTLMLVRYNSNGSPDTSFDGDGSVLTSISCNPPRCDVAIQSDGKFVAVGFSAYNDFLLTRRNSDGSLDTSFGTSGRVLTDFGGYDQAHDVALQPNGKILVAGTTANTNFALARYHSDGTLDTSFSFDGRVITDFGAEEFGNALAIQSDGNIVVAGDTRVGGQRDFAVARYLGCTSPSPCLTLTKTVQVSQTPLQPGDPLTYTLVLANQGAGNAAGVVITDTLSSYVIGPALNQTVNVAAGESLTFTLAATLSDTAPFGQMITNTAYYSHTSATGQASTAFSVAGPPQLALTKTVQLSQTPLQPGDPLTYTVVIANQGTGNATGVVITDTLPSYVIGPALNQTVNVAAGESLTFTLAATLSATTPFGEVITNTAYFSHLLTAGQASTAFTVAGPPQLALTKTVQLSQIPLQPGDPLTYTVVIANLGTGNATGVVVTDTLPAYVLGPDLNQTVNVAAGESLTFTLAATLSDTTPFGEVITNTAYFSHPLTAGQARAAFLVQEMKPVYLPIISKN